MILVTHHLFHHLSIFAQATNDVGIERGAVKVTGVVFFQQGHGSLKGADDKVLAIEAVAKLYVALVLLRSAIDKEFKKLILDGIHVFGVHSLFPRELDLALKVAGQRR